MPILTILWRLIMMDKSAEMSGKGILITFEGGEGSGKSSHIDRVIGRLQAEGHNVILAREPGGTPIGEQIRHVLQYSQQSESMSPETELLLFCASRAQLVREVIRPALDRGEIVICGSFS